MLRSIDQPRLFAELGYVPTPGQWLVHNSPAKIRVLAAAARWGKSLVGAAEIMKFAMVPDMKIGIYGPTYSLTKRSEWAWVLRMLGDSGILGVVRINDPSIGESFIETPWRSKIFVRSCDNEKSLLGEEIDLAVLCEASQIKQSTMERYIIPRLTARSGYMLLPSTPCGDTWFKEWYDRGQKRDEFPEYESWNFGLLGVNGNPFFPESQVEWARKNLAKEFFEEAYEGKFVSLCGRVYKDFSRELHVVESLPQGWQDWPVIRGIDFGYTNPFACVWAAISPDQSIYVFDEVYGAQITTDVWAERIKDKSKGMRIYTSIADHDAEERAFLNKSGVPTLPAIKNSTEFSGGTHKGIRISIQVIQTLLKPTGGKPRLFVKASCKNTIEEFQKYCWPESKPDTGREESELPLDRYSHAMDALRYAVYWWVKQHRWSIWEKLIK